MKTPNRKQSPSKPKKAQKLTNPCVSQPCNSNINNTEKESDGMKEACGIIGIVNVNNAAPLCATGLFALQHRGEEAAGLVAMNELGHRKSYGLGQISRVFENEKFEKYDNYRTAIAHTRYSVTGASKDAKNIQPLFVNHMRGSFAIAHNGNLVNSKELRKSLESEGAIFQTSMDSEIFVHLIAKHKGNFTDALKKACNKVKGSFSILIITNKGIYAMRDKQGFKPLCYGKIPTEPENLFKSIKGESYVIASETCALDLLDAKYMGQVHPGELVFFSNTGEIEKLHWSDDNEETLERKCVFEMIYFARPDSLVFGESVYAYRKATGRILAEESPVKDADLVVPVPDSGNISAHGYANAMNLPFEMAITKNHYSGRSFIQPTQAMRDITVKMKLNPIKNVVFGKRIVLVDDSLVRGTTTKQKIKTLRECGAAEIHLRVASPRIMNPCYYGIDFPSKDELIANHKNLEETRKYLGLDSFAHLSIKGMLQASENIGFCDACFSGNYPVLVKKQQELAMQNKEMMVGNESQL